MRKTNPFELFDIQITDSPFQILKKVAMRLDEFRQKPHFFASINGQVVSLADIPTLIVQVAISSFERKQDYDLFHALLQEAMLFEAFVQKGVAASAHRESYRYWTMRDRINSMHLVLTGLKQRVLEGGNPTKPSISALHLLAILEDQLPASLLDGLLIEDYGGLRNLLFAELPTLLHYARRNRPLETQRFLGEIEDLASLDPVFKEKMQLLKSKTVENLDDWKAFKVQPSGLKQNSPIQHYPIELAQPQGLKNKLVHFFTTRWERGPSKSVQLAYVSVVSLTLIFLTTAFSYALFTSKKVEVEFEHNRPMYVEKAPKFKKEASKYIGNQLPNGSQAFPLCYGEIVRDKAAANSAIVKNQLTDDAVVVFYNKTMKKTIRHTYVQASKSVLLRDLPNGEYQVKFYLGRDWNPLKPNFCGLHGAFDTDTRYVILSPKLAPIELTGNNHKKIKLEMPEGTFKTKHFPDISASMFFFNHYDLHGHKTVISDK